jgi:OmcA/MtrC family decaheme c-type cytochrome
MQTVQEEILMTWSKSLSLWFRRVLGFSIVLLAVAGCGGGSDGDKGPPGPQGPPGPPGTPITATELNITVDSVTIASPPVVQFKVTNEHGVGFPGLTGNDLRFNIAKLIPGIPTQWQNYIVRVRDGAIQGTQERNLTCPDPETGGEKDCLDDHGDGTYTYTFATDITDVPCPAPCTDADGNPLNLSYQPGQTHRLAIQQGNRDFPLVNAVFDFVPAGGPVTSMREIVKTANCNECHDKITAHGTRFEVQLCVTCHNPGSWIKNADNTTTTVDFKVMIHKIHRGEGLPSVIGPDKVLGTADDGKYAVGSHDFSDIVFPQDIRNCTKCHDGDDPETPQGNNWQVVPSMEACGSCHDDIDFSQGIAGGHKGGVVTTNSECTVCHKEGSIAHSVAESHTIRGKVARGFFKFNILEICGTAVGSNPAPVCPPTTDPTVKFSVTDPTGATTHQYGNAYNVRSTGADKEFNNSLPNNTSAASLNVLIAWDTRDYTNEGGIGTRPSRADSVNLRTSAAVTDNGDGTFTFKGSAVTPTPAVIPENATGSGAIALEGHPAADDGTGAFTVPVPVNSEVAYFAITDSTPKPRRQVVDVPTKCDRCHDVLNVHGNNRNNNGQLCVLCHNPSNTDVAQRPKDAGTGLPLISQVDGKTEESIDFKRLIHGIHAASKTNFDGTQAHGFREKGLVIYGFGGSVNDFSHVRFPGVLSKCETCHLPDTYTLADRTPDGGGNWELPTMSGIRGSTVHSYPSADPEAIDFDGTTFSDALVNQADDYKYSPIASVCSACHDGTLSRAHMENNGALFGTFDVEKGRIVNGFEQVIQAGNVEACPVCHGPGKLADVKLVHNEAFAEFLGEIIPPLQ